MRDLAVIITSLRDVEWLAPCLRTLTDACEGVDTQITVVDITPDDGGPPDETRALLEARFPDVRVVETRNGGYAHANNVGLAVADPSRWVLFLNPDTEIVDGTFRGLLDDLDRRPDVGLVGCRQLDGDGRLYPTMRRFSGPGRALAEALGSERFAPSAGQRVLDMAGYEHDAACDWTIGSFMLMRREALLSAGCMDERFFLYSEEEDLCLRVRRAGWDIRHVPTMTIVHHVGKAGVVPRLVAQRAYARRQYAEKHLGPVARPVYIASVGLGLALRWAAARTRGAAAEADGAAWGLAALTGRKEPPFGRDAMTALPAGELQRARDGLRPADIRDEMVMEY